MRHSLAIASTALSLLFLSLLLLVSCAAMQFPLPSPEQAAKARANFQSHTCNYDGAFEWGLNEANRNEEMNGQGLSAYCPPETRATVMAGYRAGYMSVINRPGNLPTTIVVNPSLSRRAQECLDAYGRRACGYGCQAAGGVVACARNPNHDCIIYAGKVYCGLNCQGRGARVVCDVAE